MSQELSRRKFLENSTVAAATVAAAGTLVASQATGAQVAPQAGGKAEKEYQSMAIEKKNQVATIRIGGGHPTPGRGGEADLHTDLAEVFSDLRGDNSIRVIVLAWADGLPTYPVDAHKVRADNPTSYSSTTDPKGAWREYLSVVRLHDAMIAIEKPIVARLYEDTVGFQANIIFASDIIVAREDAYIADHHLGDVVAPDGRIIRDSSSIVPGDGGAAWAPLYMSPAKAKEYLMLDKPYTAKELAQLGIINYAVPAAQVDKVVNDIVARLLQRSAYALAWTKRVVNSHYVERMTNSLNAAIAYEMINQSQLEKLGYKSPTTLE
jgi:enoyl-CoA hydratase/carnithine racemase